MSPSSFGLGRDEAPMDADVLDQGGFKSLKVIGIGRFGPMTDAVVMPLFVSLPADADSEAGRYAVWDGPGASLAAETHLCMLRRFAGGRTLDLPGDRAYRAVCVGRKYVAELFDPHGDAVDFASLFRVSPLFHEYAYDEGLEAYYLICDDETQAQAAHRVWFTYVEALITQLTACREPAWVRLRTLIRCLHRLGGPYTKAQRCILDALTEAFRRMVEKFHHQEGPFGNEDFRDSMFYSDPADKARMNALAKAYEQALREKWGKPPSGLVP